MKAICDHSFEGVKKGQETMSLFMSENIQKSRAAIEEMQSQGVAFLNMYSFVPVGMKHAFAPNQYLVAMGSLPQVKTNWIEDGDTHIVYPTIVALASKTSYGDIISKESGTTAQRHIQDAVIERSKQLLVETRLPVSEIAYQLGFEYPQHFSRLFKSRIGMTPNEYRLTA